MKDGATTTIDGTLTSAPSTSYFIEYFSTPTCTGEPQGQTYLGFQSVTTDVAGNATFSFSAAACRPRRGDHRDRDEPGDELTRPSSRPA